MLYIPPKVQSVHAITRMMSFGTESFFLDLYSDHNVQKIMMVLGITIRATNSAAEFPRSGYMTSVNPGEPNDEQSPGYLPSSSVVSVKFIQIQNSFVCV